MLAFPLTFALATLAAISGVDAAAIDRRTWNTTGVEFFTGNSSKTLPYYTKSYESGLGTYFNGAPSALACGDVRNSTETQKFAALCHTLFDTAPGVTSIVNPNKNPVCGPYTAGRKDVSGNWMGAPNATDYVTVGGDGAYSCIGLPGVQCHIPRTLTISYGGKNVTGVQIVDRMGREACSENDLDISQLVFMELAGSLTQGLLHDITWTFEN
ncbi:hypothetical protein RQP46_003243 [Phenoliferia psychrophenolica]